MSKLIAHCHECWINWDMPKEVVEGAVVCCPRCYEDMMVVVDKKLVESKEGENV